MKITNENLKEIFDNIDKYENESDFIVTSNTKVNLKHLLISGADANSDNFASKFPDEYHLWRKVRHMMGY